MERYDNVMSLYHLVSSYSDEDMELPTACVYKHPDNQRDAFESSGNIKLDATDTEVGRI